MIFMITSRIHILAVCFLHRTPYVRNIALDSVVADICLHVADQCTFDGALRSGSRLRVVFRSCTVACRRMEHHILKQEANLLGRGLDKCLQIAEGTGIVCEAVFSAFVIEVLLDTILTIKFIVPFLGGGIGVLSFTHLRQVEIHEDYDLTLIESGVSVIDPENHRRTISRRQNIVRLGILQRDRHVELAVQAVSKLESRTKTCLQTIHVYGLSCISSSELFAQHTNRISDRRMDRRHVQVSFNIILRILLHVVRSILGSVSLNGHVSLHDEITSLDFFKICPLKIIRNFTKRLSVIDMFRRDRGRTVSKRNIPTQKCRVSLVSNICPLLVVFFTWNYFIDIVRYGRCWIYCRFFDAFLCFLLWSLLNFPGIVPCLL